MRFDKILKNGLALSVACTTILSSTTVQAAGNVHADITENQVRLSNEYIARDFTIADQHIKTSQIRNLRANTTLVPQNGSDDFIINLLTKDSAPDPVEKTEMKKEYVYSGLEGKLDTTAWKASISNSKGIKFDEAQTKKIFDGNVATYIDNYSISGNPFTVDINLGSVQKISSMSVNKRPGYSEVAYGINGTMGDYEIWINAGDDENGWTKLKEGTFTKEDYNLHKEGNLYNVGDMVYVNFDHEVDAKQIRVIQKTTALSTAQEFSSAEIAFYQGKLEKTLKIVEPTQVLNRDNWTVSIQNKAGTKFSDTHAKKIIDGNLNSNPDEFTKGGNPFNVDIDLGSVQSVSSFSIDKRPGYGDKNYGINGTMGEYEVYISEDKEQWQIVGAGNFKAEAYNLHQEGNLFNVGDRVYANLLDTYETRYIRIVQKSCSMGASEEFTSAEVNLYSDTYQGYDWSGEIHGKPITTAIQSSQLIFDKAVSEDTENGGKKVTISYKPFEKDEVTYTIDLVNVLEADDHYMRSFIEIKTSDPEKAQIEYIDQDHFVLPSDAKDVWSHPEDSEISSMWIGQHELMLGQPIYANGFFMGSEFPAADTIIKNNETQIRYYSGKSFAKMAEDGQLTKDGKFVSWQNVIGAARDTSNAVVQTDFFAYIKEIATPTDFRKQYNSWYDNMMNITDESIAKSFNGAEAGLSAEGIEPLDAYVVDDGWNNYYDTTFTKPGESAGKDTPNQTGFWEFNNKFPNELYTSSSLSSKYNSNFGLWVGPQGGYNFFSTFAQYLESVGTGFVQPSSVLGKVVCTGSHKYLTNFTNRFVDYQSRFNIDYWKWDGFANRPCTDASHDHMTGGENNMYFTSDLWEGWIKVIDAIRDARTKEGKGLWINATCYVNLSPWLLQWVNSVWVQDSGDTGSLGTGSRFEQKIYYRDDVYNNLYKKNQIQFPMANIYNHDPIYGVSDGSNATSEDFREYLMANAVRGTAFWELYYSPSIMDEAKWKITADVLEFAQSNHDILKNAKLFGNGPKQGVYGYSSWTDSEGIISFTNPGDEAKTYTIELNSDIGVPLTLKNAKAVQIEPYQAGLLSESFTYGNSIQVELKAHETKIYQIGHQDSEAPSLVSAKVTGENQVTLKFSERISDASIFALNSKPATSVLQEDYRTVIVTSSDKFNKDAEVKVTSDEISDSYGNTSKLTKNVIAYENGKVAKVSSKQDLKDAADMKEEAYSDTIKFMKLDGEKELTTSNQVSLDQDFTLSMAVKTGASNVGLWKQGNNAQLRIDEQGYAVFDVNGQSVSSKETVTEVVEKAHGLFGTDAHVPTTTKETIIGKVNDNDFHTIMAVKEPNGMLKLYVDGALCASTFDKTKNNVATNKEVSSMRIGDTNFHGYVANVEVMNRAFDYKEADKIAKSYHLNQDSDIVDRTSWVASACSQMPGMSGDASAMAAIDGNTGSWWHTNYNNGDSHALKDHWIQIDFSQDIKFDNFIYTGRGGSNGDIKDFILEANINGEWKTIKEGSFEGKESIIKLDETITASAIKLIPLSTVNGKNYAAAVEINVSRNIDKLASEADVKALLDAAEQLLADDYAKDSFKAYQEVYEEIHNLDAWMVRTSVLNDLTSRLQNAKNNLISVKELRVAIEKAKEEVKKTDMYTADSILALQNKIQAASALIEATNVTADDISVAIKDLDKSIETLVKRVSDQELKALQNEAKAVNEKEFTEKSAQVYNAICDIIQKLDVSNMEMDAFENYKNELTTARSKLVSVKELKEEIARFQVQLASGTLTKDSEKQANKLSNQASALLMDGSSEAVLSTLNEMKNYQFEYKVDKETLKQQINTYRELQQSMYTNDSWNAFQLVMAQAERILNDEGASAQDVQNAIKDLLQAYTSLELKSDSSTSLTNQDGSVIVTGNGLDATMELYTKKLTAQECAGIIQGIKDRTFVSNVTFENIMDIYIMSEGAIVQPNGTMNVKIKLNEDIKNKKLGVVYIDQEGNLKVMKSWVEGDFLCFETDHFSTYAIVSFKDEQMPPLTPDVPEIKEPIKDVDTKDTTTVSIFMMLLVLGGFVAIKSFSKATK